MKALIEKLRNPAWLIAAIVAAAIAAIFLVQGTVGWLAAGGAAQIIAGLMAFGLFLFIVVMIRVLTLTIRPEVSNVVSQNPVARAILSAGVLLAGAVIVHSAFGG